MQLRLMGCGHVMYDQPTRYRSDWLQLTPVHGSQQLTILAIAENIKIFCTACQGCRSSWFNFSRTISRYFSVRSRTLDSASIASRAPCHYATHSIHEQCAIGIFFLRLLLWQLLLKLLRIRFLNRSYPGTPPFRCRESRPYHEEPRLKTSF